MTKYTIKHTTQFKKDYKLAKRRNMDIDLLKDIITEAVHEFAKEPYYNIIVNDLDDVGLELMEYRGDVAIYFLVNKNTNEVDNYRFADDVDGYYYLEDETAINVSLNNIPHYDERITLDFGKKLFEPTEIYAIDDVFQETPYSFR